MIRPMTSKDILYVQHIAVETWRATYENIIPADAQLRFLNQSYSDIMLLKRMEKTLMLIAECDGVPIGFANVTYIDEDGDAELTAMYILPTYQQSGYGHKLFQAALSHLAEAKQLFVYVDNQNVIGKNFYVKQGFQLLNTFSESFNGHPVETAEYVYKIPVAIS
ncbi:GNAT family N-acetyltransferase [Sporosarcina ureilytica]|uniref:GNAT family N-acetyltransferase n=1 Tax=Sporosarcina ureilytica TaxID=298596 RepID=A0A1D8JD70_9BACL|nr:GNAT family N-acetyltransferase [Sporosarcina ureilytica]AOV06652.1 GNAT family N-acetyltransferase [Sporosarcina ureilytica]